MNSNMGRSLRRRAEREARRKDGKQRNVLSERQGKGIAIYRAGRVQQVGR